MVPFSFGCGSAVLAAIATLAPSRAARSAIASPMPRLPPEMNSVLPLRDVMGASVVSTVAVIHLSHRERSTRSVGEGLQTNDRPYLLTPTLSPWERGRTFVVANSVA